MDFFSIQKAAELLDIEDTYMNYLLIKGEVRLCVQVSNLNAMGICELNNNASFDDLFPDDTVHENKIDEFDYFPYAPVKLKNAIDTKLSLFDDCTPSENPSSIYASHGYLSGVWHIPALYVEDILNKSDAFEHDIELWPLYGEQENPHKDLTIIEGFRYRFRNADSNMVICREDIVKLQKSLQSDKEQGKPHGNSVRNQQVRGDVLEFALEMKAEFPDQCKNAVDWAKTVDEKAQLRWDTRVPPLSHIVIIKMLREYNNQEKKNNSACK